MKVKTRDIFEFLIYFTLLIPFFKPSYIGSQIELLNKIFNICQIISMSLILCLYIKREKCSKFILSIVIFELTIVISTIINDAYIKESIFSMIQIISICMILEYGINTDSKNVMNALLCIYELLIFINFITIFMFPKGMYLQNITNAGNNWFLGNDNQHIKYFITGICISIVYSINYYKKIKIRTIFLVLIVSVSVIIRKSATGIVGTIVLYLLIWSLIMSKQRYFLDIRKLLVIYSAIFFGVVIFRLQNIFSYLIVNILEKDITFTGRTFIWDYTIRYFKQKPFLGYGVEETIIRLEKYANSNAINPVNAHNQLLEILYQGGIVLFIMFIGIIKQSSEKLYKYKENIISKIISYAIFSLLITMLTEVFKLENFIILLTLGYNIEKIIKNGEKVGE